MAASIVERDPQATALSPQLSMALTAALGDRTEGYIGENGFDVRRAEWKPPAVIPDSLRAEARGVLARVDLENKADGRSIAEWVGKLGILVAGNMTADDARAKMAAYGSMLAGQYPRAMLTRDGLDRAARAFKWFPSYSELSEHLDREFRRMQRERRRLEALAGEPAPEAMAAPIRRLVSSAIKTVVPKPEKAA